MAVIITVEDLPQSVRDSVDASLLDDMVAGANAKASRVAPCLATTDPGPTADQIAEAKLVLLGAVKRWADAGSGAYQSQTAGPFSVAMDTRQRSGYNLWPSEIGDLEELCRTVTGDEGDAYSVDTIPLVYTSDLDRLGYESGTWSTTTGWTPA